MFFILPLTSVLLVYILAAVLPACILLRYIYRQDHVEREPLGLLLSLLGMGALAVIVSIVLELAGEAVLSATVEPGSPLYVLLLAFFVVSAVEEGAKLFFLKRRTWHIADFNYRFDGVVYAVFVSLGFAALENIQYVFSYGLSVALPRALLAIPGHMSFAVFMGLFYGRAKLCANRGDRVGKTGNLLAGYLLAVVLHGVYDFCAMLGSTAATVVFLGFVIVMFVAVFHVVRREAQTDQPL